jgi:hypothetical protein
MRKISLGDLQESLADKSGFTQLADYAKFGSAFLALLEAEKPTRIVSPSPANEHYVFYQYGKANRNKITRPLNTHLYFESRDELSAAFDRFVEFLGDLKKHKQGVAKSKGRKQYLESNEINRVVYTLQQSVGCVGDSFENENQSRKRIGQLFESMVKLIIKEIGVTCEPRVINIPIPGFLGREMSYELDVVFSRNKAIIASETKHIHAAEVVGSVKTTSKDRIEPQPKPNSSPVGAAYSAPTELDWFFDFMGYKDASPTGFLAFHHSAFILHHSLFTPAR